MGAMPHLESVALWPLAEFREWAKNALAVVRDVRRNFSEPGDLIWRAEAAQAFELHGLDATGLFARLQARSAARDLTPVN